MILYFGMNGDNPFFEAYYRRVDALLRASPALRLPHEVEAALSLRWPHPALVRTFLVLARSRLFVGMKLLVDRLSPGASTGMQEAGIEEAGDPAFRVESVHRLVTAALEDGAKVLLIPELAGYGAHDYESIFQTVRERSPGGRVTTLSVEGEALEPYLVDHCHMNAQGYRKLAEVIATHLVDSGLAPRSAPDAPPPRTRHGSGPPRNPGGHGL